VESTSKNASVDEVGRDSLSHRGFVVGHDEVRLEFGENLADLGEQLLVQLELPGSHDDRQDADRFSVVIGDDIQDLNRKNKHLKNVKFRYVFL